MVLGAVCANQCSLFHADAHTQTPITRSSDILLFQSNTMSTTRPCKKRRIVVNNTHVLFEPQLTFEDALRTGVRVLVIETRREKGQKNHIPCSLRIRPGLVCDGTYSCFSTPAGSGNGCQVCTAISEHLIPDTCGLSLQYHHAVKVEHEYTPETLCGVRGHQTSVRQTSDVLNPVQLQTLYSVSGNVPLPRYTICVCSPFVKNILERVKTQECRGQDIVRRFMVAPFRKRASK